MATSIPSLSSALAPAFTGVSKFGSSLQQVLTRAVGIASLPLDSLNAGLTTLNNKQNAVQGLSNAFSQLQQSVGSLQTALSSTLLDSSISDASAVNATVGAGASAGTYSVEVTSLGNYSTALSSGGTSPVADPSKSGISSSTSFTLTVGGTATTITSVSSSLQDLANALNTRASDQVQATVVNVGSTSVPDYRLSLRAAKLGTNSISLTDTSGTNLISSSTQGSLATYKVNGLSTPISSDSRTVTLAPGLQVGLLSQSAAGVAATITVSDNAAGLASAFSSFAQSYNAALEAINENHGQSGGALQGESLLQSLTGVLRQLGNYNSGTPSSALANYGITVDKSGQLSIDSGAFATAANADFPALLTTLGSTTGGGFLKAATNLLNGVEDSTNGLLPSEAASLATEITTQQSRIADEQSIIDTLQTNLTAQISSADSAIASLESQVSYVTGLFGQYTGATNTQANGLSTL